MNIALMASMVIPLLTFIINRAQILEFIDEAIFAVTKQLPTLFRSPPLNCFFILYAACSFLGIIALAWMVALYLKKKRSFNDKPNRYDDEYLAANDTEKMQFNESLHSDFFNPRYLLSYTTVNDESSSREERFFTNELVNYEKMCEICLEDEEIGQMFKNDESSSDEERTLCTELVNCKNEVENSHLSEICLEDEDIRQMFKNDEYSFEEERTFSTVLVNCENEVENSFLSEICLEDKEIRQILRNDESSSKKKPNYIFEMVNYENEVDNSYLCEIRFGGKVFRQMLKKDESSYNKQRFYNKVFSSFEDKEIRQMFKKDKSSSGEEQFFRTELVNYENEVNNSFFCEICLENKESWQMFKNEKCCHSFCYECITNYITAKIKDKAKAINCPSVNCKATLDSNACRLMIPETVLVKWDEMRCMSLIRESSKLYCPFRECSAMLVKDYGAILRKVKCVACKRSFCAECSVPWHMGLSCKVFQKLHRKKGGKDDKIVKSLAKMNNWQKCPQCKMYVEKTEGCVHMTCRCKYEFCYRCGSRWSNSHASKCMRVARN